MRMLIAFAAVVLMASSAAGQTPPVQTLSGELTGSSGRATFQVPLEAGQAVTLTTSSEGGLDTVLTLNGPNGRRVAQNDDQAAGVLTSRITYTADRAGTYSAVVTGYNGARGAFELRIAHGLDFGLSAEARSLREERQSLDRTRTEYRTEVDLAAGETFVASTFALTENLDTTLTLQTAGGAVLAQNDDVSEGNFNSQVVYQPATAGRYVVIVSTYTGDGVGQFALSLAVDENVEAPFNFASITGTEIARHDGSLTEAQPSSEYRVDLAAGQTLLATVDGTSGNLDPVLRLSDPAGDPVALNDDRGDGSLNSAFAYTAPTAGTYVLEVSRFRQSDTSGNYRLVLTSVEASVVETLQALIEAQITLSGPEIVIDTADFHVYYTVEGRDASTPEYAQAVAETMQRVLDTQVHQIGWNAPVRGRDGRYRVYIADARGLMGFAPRLQMVFDNPNSASARETAATRGMLVLDNDFADMMKKATPIALMHATATHELNHLVQFGYDGDEGLNWLYEATASWTETATVGVDQDATDYVETDLLAPQLCWTTTTYGHDYAQWTLLQSLADAHGQGIVLRIWENAVRYDGFETMSQTLAAVGTNIPDAIQRWRVQNFALDYDLAPLFTASVHSVGTISRNGTFSPREQIQQLGAQYVQVRMQGARFYTLEGDANLELIALGIRDGQVEAIPLGRGGVFDTTGYQNATLMVFNRAVPASPGDCTDVRYTIRTGAATQGTTPAAAYRFSAEHFRRPS